MEKKYKISIIGLGYVGLPLAFSEYYKVLVYDDIFWKRMFGSTITKESSVMDRKINQYMIGLDALLEAERIKAEIFNMEHDLWEY